MEQHQAPLIAGACAGIVGAVIGQPLDTLKVRMQASLPLSSKGLYKGLVPQVCIQLMGNTVLFGIYDALRGEREYSIPAAFISGIAESLVYTPFECLKTRRQAGIPFKMRNAFSGFRYTAMREGFGNCVYFGAYTYFRKQRNFDPFLAGSLAGVSYWTVIYPIDTAKTLRQLGEPIQIRGLYRGLSICLLRSVPVNGAVFATYEKVLSELVK
jgi:hypothetical protein